MLGLLDPLLWIVGFSICSSLLAGLLIRYLFQYSGRPGANWFIGTLTVVAIFCTSYGVSLVVFDPSLRLALETLTFVALCFMGPLFLGFGLDYLGRSDLIRSPLFGAALAVPVINLLVAVTNHQHGFLWTDFQLDPAFGGATVQYSLQPWGWFALAFGFAMTGIGVLLLVGAILEYGPLYRREAAAVIVSIVPPSIGLTLWMFDLGPVPQLNLAPVLFVPHLLLDGYAFVGTHMFETNPATQRAAERTALDDRSEPQLVVDTEAQIVNLNSRARQVFALPADRSLPISLDQAIGIPLEELLTRGDIDISGEFGGVFAVSHTPLTDPQDDSVGHLLVFYDITEERRRKQQLGVLNRVLRHNLRNEMTVVNGYAESIAANPADTEVRDQAETIAAASQRVLRIAEQVRDFDRIQDRELQLDSVDVESVVTDVCADFRESHPAAKVNTAVERSSEPFVTDRDVLTVILSTFIENAIIHAEVPDPTVHIRVYDAPNDQLCIEIRDNNPQIPAIETEPLRVGDETQLQHGRGIGLWIANWCLTSLNGEVEFDYADGNIIMVKIPERDQQALSR